MVKKTAKRLSQVLLTGPGCRDAQGGGGVIAVVVVIIYVEVLLGHCKGYKERKDDFGEMHFLESGLGWVARSVDREVCADWKAK